MLLPAGRLVVVKKLGWPRVSSFSLSCEYVKVTAARVLGAAEETVWLASGRPRVDPKPTLNVTLMVPVHVVLSMLMAVCSSWRKLAIWPAVNCTPALLKSLLTKICMASSPENGPRRGIEFPRVRSQMLASASHPQRGL